jgi:hypothetical protein
MIFPERINKLSHTMLFAEDTSIVFTSTIHIVLNQKFNSKLHHISNAPIYPLNTIHANQILAIAETITLSGLHLDSHLSWKSHKNILLKKLTSVCFMMRNLHTQHGYNMNSLLCTLSATDRLRYNCLGIINTHAQFIFNTK